jgi:glycopeptide antibiotics resistance protein
MNSRSKKKVGVTANNQNKKSSLEAYIRQMELKQISKWFVITGTLLIWFVKYILRPMDLFDEPVKFFLGIAPNLIGSFLIPFGAYWFFSGRNFLIARVFRIQSAYDLRLVCLLGFGMLIVNEYLQLIPFFGRTFDFNDIIFSFVGLLAAWFVFGKLYQRFRVQAD